MINLFSFSPINKKKELKTKTINKIPKKFFTASKKEPSRNKVAIMYNKVKATNAKYRGVKFIAKFILKGLRMMPNFSTNSSNSILLKELNFTFLSSELVLYILTRVL